MIRIALAIPALALAASCASYVSSPAEMSQAGVACRNNSLSFPDQRVAMKFEEAPLCMHMADAYAAKLLNKPLDAKNADWAGAVEWMNTQLDQGDTVIVDRFGRATLTRCSTDPALTTPAFKPEPKIGDGKRQLYLMIETPCQNPRPDAGFLTIAFWRPARRFRDRGLRLSGLQRALAPRGCDPTDRDVSVGGRRRARRVPRLSAA